MQLVKISFLKFHRRRIPVVSTRCSLRPELRLARVGVKIPQDGNRANVYEHPMVVHKSCKRVRAPDGGA